MSLASLKPHEKNGRYRVVIETPKGSRNKYAYDEASGLMVLRKVLPLGHVFPFDFGWVPQTKAEDGDPLDVLVLMDEAAFPGCVVSCRLVGLVEGEQIERGKKQRNDRLLAVAEASLLFREVRDVSDLEASLIEQIRHFLTSYNSIGGKRFNVLRVTGAARARAAVGRAIVA
jgi:inorganic pyrophosphatase